MGRKRAAQTTDEQPAGEAEAGTAKINKADAVRAAIADGVDMPEEGVAYIQKKFGIEVTKSQFSTYKSLDKKRKGGGQEGHGRQRRKAATPAAPTPAALPPSGSNGPTGLAIQVEAIKTLVDQLGIDQVVSIARLFAK